MQRLTVGVTPMEFGFKMFTPNLSVTIFLQRTVVCTTTTSYIVQCHLATVTHCEQFSNTPKKFDFWSVFIILWDTVKGSSPNALAISCTVALCNKKQQHDDIFVKRRNYFLRQCYQPHYVVISTLVFCQFVLVLSCCYCRVRIIFCHRSKGWCNLCVGRIVQKAKILDRGE